MRGPATILCPVCHGEGGRVIYHQRDSHDLVRGLIGPADLEIIEKCESCDGTGEIDPLDQKHQP